MDLDRIIRQHGFDLVRQKKHKVYRHPDGRTFVASNTPSDWRSTLNELHDFANLVGVPKHHLIRPPRPKREHTRLEPLEKPTALHPPAPETIPVPIASSFTKAELKKLRRWEKHYKQQEAKEAKLQQDLEQMLRVIEHEVAKRGVDRSAILGTVYYLLHKQGRHPKVCGVAVDNQERLFQTLKVGPFYLDPVACKARRETHWVTDDTRVEILGELQPWEIQ